MSRNVLVTGGNSGVGLALCKLLIKVIFKRDLARALLRIWFVVLVLVIVSPKSKIAPFHVTFTTLCQYAISWYSQRILKNFPKNSQRAPKEFPKSSQKIPKNSQKIAYKLHKNIWLALIGRNPFRACSHCIAAFWTFIKYDICNIIIWSDACYRS